MIPKIIHYCWFGRKSLPELSIKCIDTWKKFCSDYQIICWNEENTDLNKNSYVEEAYRAKKWAFVSDYIRLKVLYDHGGIYMDTDVEVCKSLDIFLHEKAFSGFENSTQIPTGIMASEKGHPFFKELLEYYAGRHFINADGSYDTKTNVITITEIATRYGFIPNDKQQTIQNMTFYPHDFFCPKDFNTAEINITKNTVCIHHFNGSWLSEKERKEQKMIQWLNRHCGKWGSFFYEICKYILHPILLVKKTKGKIQKFLNADRCK